jgi:chloramphenicol 3-O phosphotransferase
MAIDGKIVLLNGTSSAGKSTIASYLQESMDEPYLRTGIDHWLERMPPSFFVTTNGDTQESADGYLLIFRDGQVETSVSAAGATEYHGARLSEVRVGPAALRFLSGMYMAVRAIAAAGTNVIVDDVIYDMRVLRAAACALSGKHAFFVGLRCPLEIVEQRERERGDRAIGGARAFHDLVHQGGVYDLELNTSVISARKCARAIKDHLDYGPAPSAFARLAAAL